MPRKTIAYYLGKVYVGFHCKVVYKYQKKSKIDSPGFHPHPYS